MPEHLAWALAILALSAGLAIGWLWHRRYENRVLRAEWHAGYDHGYDKGYDAGWLDARPWPADVPRPGDLPDGQTGPREDTGPGCIQAEAETTSEFLSAPLEPGAYIYDPLTPAALDADWRERTEVPRPESRRDHGPELHVQEGSNPSPGPGHDPHWYASGLHFIADWQAEWHRDAERTDEAIARWSAGARELLAADPWDRSARMLERA